jgi:hypothetical protein
MEEVPSQGERLQEIYNKAKVINDLKSKIEQLHIPSRHVIMPNDSAYDRLFRFMMQPSNIQPTIMQLSARDYIRHITIYPSYDPYDSPDPNRPHSIAEKAHYLLRLNALLDDRVFDYTTLDFADIDGNICKYLGREMPHTTILETLIVKNFAMRLAVLLCTSTEMAFRDNDNSRIDAKFRKVIARDYAEVAAACGARDNKAYVSWETFCNALTNIRDENLIYRFDGYDRLSLQLDQAYDVDFMMENLLGTMMKSMFPSIALDYFYAMKSIYILGRLLSLYVKRDRRADATLESITEELYTIAVAAITCYENKQMLYKQLVRKSPQYNKGTIHHHTEAYLFHHYAVGGQYYMLKTMEQAIPLLAMHLIA